MRKREALLACLLIVAGCGTHDKDDLDRQKALLDLMKAQNEQLSELTKKESDLRALEKRNQEALREIQQQRAELQRLQEELAQKRVKMQEAIAKEEARLKAEKEQLQSEKLENQQALQETAAMKAELERQLTAIKKRDEAERLAKEAGPRGAAGALGKAFLKAAASSPAARHSSGVLTTPVATYFAAKEMIAFRIQIPGAMKNYKARNGSAPKTQEEFMEKIIKEHGIQLPQLPPGQRYVYLPDKEDLFVEHPQ